MSPEQKPPWRAKIGLRSWWAVLILAGEALIECLKLPFRVVFFLARRKAVRDGIREMLVKKRTVE